MVKARGTFGCRCQANCGPGFSGDSESDCDVLERVVMAAPAENGCCCKPCLDAVEIKIN